MIQFTEAAEAGEALAVGVPAPELRGLHYTYLAEKFRCGHPDGEVLAAVLRRCGEALVAQP
jgi:hypothetical protein